MKIESYVFLFVGFFFGLVGLVYWLLSYEDAGSTMLLGTFLLGSVPGFYYFWWSRRMSPRPADDPKASVEDGAGVVGAFPGSSIWPFVIGIRGRPVPGRRFSRWCHLREPPRRARLTRLARPRARFRARTAFGTGISDGTACRPIALAG